MPASMFPEVSVFCPNGDPRNHSVSEPAMNQASCSTVSRSNHSRRRIWFLAANLGFTVCVLVSHGALGQTRPSTLPDPTNAMMRTYNPQGATLVLTVLSENGTRLDRQAVVKLTNLSTQKVMWQTTTKGAEATFVDLPVVRYDVDVSAVGYLTGNKEISGLGALNTYRVEITLQRDPNSIDLSAPTVSQMPKKARNETLRGIAALTSGNFKEAQKRLDVAYKIYPDSADLNFLLGYMALQQKQVEPAKNYLERAATLDPHNARTLILLGRLYLQREDYAAARTTLEHAVIADPQDGTAHAFLAEAYFRQLDFDKALQHAQIALDKSKTGSSQAQLVLGEALANLGRTQEAIQALKTFLQETPASPMVPQVHDVIAELEKRASNPVQKVEASSKALTSLAGASLDSTESELPLQSWEPAGVDDSKPDVAAGVACPSEMVIDKAGASVQQLVDDVSRFAAIEDLRHERLDRLGIPVTLETRKFDYVVAISKPQPGFLEVNEFRSERSGLADFPDNIISRGFTALAFVFHPDMRDNFEMSCEGLGQWRGQATWLVHFGQRKDRPNRIHSYSIAGQIHPVGLKGRAWITADKFQIVRMESEMAAPMPEIQLLTEHQIVEYGPVLFEKKNEELWLPKSAEFYFDFRRHRYFRRHSFDHFMLFSVDSEEKRKEPKVESRGPRPDSYDKPQP